MHLDDNIQHNVNCRDDSDDKYNIFWLRKRLRLISIISNSNSFSLQLPYVFQLHIETVALEETTLGYWYIWENKAVEKWTLYFPKLLPSFFDETNKYWIFHCTFILKINFNSNFKSLLSQASCLYYSVRFKKQSETMVIKENWILTFHLTTVYHV